MPSPLDRLADAIASTWRWLPAAAVIDFAPGGTLWALFHTELATLADNSLAAGPRVAAVRWASPPCCSCSASTSGSPAAATPFAPGRPQ